MKYKACPSGDHCGLMCFPAPNAVTGSIEPVLVSATASCKGPMRSDSRSLENRSLAKTMRRLSGAHAGPCVEDRQRGPAADDGCHRDALARGVPRPRRVDELNAREVTIAWRVRELPQDSSGHGIRHVQVG